MGMEWVLTMILTLGGGSAPRPAVAIHTQEYYTQNTCESAKKEFLEKSTKADGSMYENKQAYCLKK